MESALRARPALRYAAASGDDPEVALETAGDLVDRIRKERRPGVLHLRTVRFSATPAPTSRRRTGRRRRSAPTGMPTRCSRPGAGWRPAARSGGGAGGGLPGRARARARGRPPQRACPSSSRPEDVSRRSLRGRRSRPAQLRRRRGGGDARAGDQSRARGRARARSHRASLRRGRCRQGRRLRRHARPAAALRCGPRLRHAARRDVDPRPCTWLGRQRLPARARDPVPRVPPQRRRPAPRGRRRPCSSSPRGGIGTAW